jgi:hypothetical protein
VRSAEIISDRESGRIAGLSDIVEMERPIRAAGEPCRRCHGKPIGGRKPDGQRRRVEAVPRSARCSRSGGPVRPRAAGGFRSRAAAGEAGPRSASATGVASGPPRRAPAAAAAAANPSGRATAEKKTKDRGSSSRARQ